MLTSINWKPSNKDLRIFGLVVLVGFGLFGGLLYWRAHHALAMGLWAGAAVVGLLAIALPPLSKPFYWAWMGLAFVLGVIISNVLLVIIFYLILTPIGLFMKIIRRDELKLKRYDHQESFWVDHPTLDRKDYYERLF